MDENTSKTGENGNVVPIQPDLIPGVGPRSKPVHPNCYGSMKHGGRTNIEKFINLVEADSPLADEMRRRIQAIGIELGGDLSIIKHQLVRRFVVIGLMLESWENRLMEGEVVPEEANNHYSALMGHFTKLAKELGLDKKTIDANTPKSAREILEQAQGAK